MTHREMVGIFVFAAVYLVGVPLFFWYGFPWARRMDARLAAKRSAKVRRGDV